jgi:endogenous inhibitor of DNA gyrase (YacG/DUF329 family)
MKEVFDKLLILYPDYSRIYGPYLRKDGRKHILLYKHDLSGKRTLSWPKALVEAREGRRLVDDEEVDHDDQDFTNNSLDNLVIRKRRDHAKLDVLRLAPVQSNCVRCGKQITLTYDQIRTTAKSGPFCSRQCSGAHGTDIQNGRGKIGRLQIDHSYYTRKGLEIISPDERKAKIELILKEKVKKNTRQREKRKEKTRIDLLAPIQMNCPWCGNQFETTLKRLRNNRKCAGPFCSKNCASKYGTSILKGGTKLAKRQF